VNNTTKAYTTSARYYDAIYHLKNYRLEVAGLRRIIDRHIQRPTETLLDVACGTGAHLTFLARYYDCIGIDLSAELIEIAREKLPSIPFHVGDMRDFNLQKQFDIVTCLFTSLSYITDYDGMRQAVANMARHIAPGGVLVIDPWLHPEQYREGLVNYDSVDTPDIKLARMSVNRRDGHCSLIEVHHMIATSEGVTTFVEPHRMALYTNEQYLDAIRDAGLQPIYEERGITDLGLYLGLKSPA
jgi:ubiquinone/menaquinone biosynthesis C-methylase UbiE